MAPVRELRKSYMVSHEGNDRQLPRMEEEKPDCRVCIPKSLQQSDLSWSFKF